MPRPKPKKSQPTFITYGHSLSDESKEKLLQILGFTDIDFLQDSVRRQHPGKKALKGIPGSPLLLVPDPDYKPPTGPDPGMIVMNIQRVLGFYVDGHDHIDNAPRPADYRDTFKSLQMKTLNFMNELHALSGYYREQIDLTGLKLQDITNNLAKLADKCGVITRYFEKQKSMGARKDTALYETVRQLKIIYKKYSQHPRDKRKVSGAFQYLSNWENKQQEFIRLSLTDARIIKTAYTKGNLTRLINDPRCALPEDRAKTIEVIAKKTKTRHRQQKGN